MNFFGWIRIKFHSSLHLLALVSDYFPSGRFEESLVWTGPSALLMPSYIPLVFLVMAAVWMSSLSWIASVEHCSLSLKVLFVRSLVLTESGAFRCNDGCTLKGLCSKPVMAFRVFLSKMARAVQYMVFHSSSQFCVEDTLDCKIPSSFSKVADNCFTCSVLGNLLVSRGGTCCLTRWDFFSCVLVLQHTREWFVSQSALWRVVRS